MDKRLKSLKILIEQLETVNEKSVKIKNFKDLGVSDSEVDKELDKLLREFGINEAKKSADSIDVPDSKGFINKFKKVYGKANEFAVRGIVLSPKDFKNEYKKYRDAYKNKEITLKQFIKNVAYDLSAMAVGKQADAMTQSSARSDASRPNPTMLAMEVIKFVGQIIMGG